MLEDMGREQMRAADTDRERVADQLREALGEGRLDLHEYDERLRDAYAAKTYGDLDRLLTDLPSTAPVVPAQVPAAPPAPARGATAAWLGHLWVPWARTAILLSAIWLITSIGSAGSAYYWPAWVAGPWGVLLVVRTVSGLTGGEPARFARAEEHHRRVREHRRERKALEADAVARGDLPENPTKEQRRAFVAQAVARGDLPPKPRKPEV
jgi:hypothetical protein